MSTSTKFAICLVTKKTVIRIHRKTLNENLMNAIQWTPNSIKNPRNEPKASSNFPLPISSPGTRTSIDLHPSVVVLMQIWLYILDGLGASRQEAAVWDKANVQSPRTTSRRTEEEFRCMLGD